MRYEKHGYATKKIHPIYYRWHRMIRRCHDKKSSDYKDYGARGIKVCEEWRESLKKFVEDMGIPSKNMTLERIDNNKGYYKKNCRWATRKEQRANQRYDKRTIFIKGKTLKEWSKILGIKYITLHKRVYDYKFPIKDILSTSRLKKRF